MVWFSSVTQSCPTLWDPMDCSTTGLPVHHQCPEFTQTYVHWVSDAIQLSHPLSSPSPPTFNLSQHQSLFQWVSSSQQVAKVLALQRQHQSFQWIFRTDFLPQQGLKTERPHLRQPDQVQVWVLFHLHHILRFEDFHLPRPLPNLGWNTWSMLCLVSFLWL